MITFNSLKKYIQYFFFFFRLAGKCFFFAMVSILQKYESDSNNIVQVIKIKDFYLEK